MNLRVNNEGNFEMKDWREGVCREEVAINDADTEEDNEAKEKMNYFEGCILYL